MKAATRQKIGLAGKLGADRLFGDSSATLPRFFEVELDALRPNPDQPRKTIAEAPIAELAASIAAHGLIHPILVAPLEDGYVIVSGERRFRAFQRLGRRTIPAILTDAQRLDEIALIENLQREDLAPLEEAEALGRMKDRYGYTHDQLAAVVGKARSTVTNLLRLLALPERIRRECSTSNIGRSVLLELASLEPKEQLRRWQQVRQGATVQQVRAAAGRPNAERPSPTQPAVRAGSSFLARLEKLSKTGADDLRDDDLAELVRLQRRIAQLINALRKGAS